VHLWVSERYDGRDKKPQNAAYPLEIFREMPSRAALRSSMVRLPSMTEERLPMTSYSTVGKSPEDL